MTGTFVLGLYEVGPEHAAMVGGKAAHLGELSRIDGIRVPAGFCVTVDAFRRAVAGAPTVLDLLDRLSGLAPEDGEAMATSAGIRRAIEATPVPEDVTAAIACALVALGQQGAYAVRSSATAEDLPGLSSAGQHDTHLNVVGQAAVLQAVSRCWASLHTQRALAYRTHNRLDHRRADMAVVVQRMVLPQAAGVLFTADPLTSNRKVVTVESCFGLGEAVVSGEVSSDVYRVRDGTIVDRTVATKRSAVRAAPGGGTVVQPIGLGRQAQASLTDAQALELARLGRRIEAHFGHPQDIEWCLGTDGFHFVQSRPITTLFPVPEAEEGTRHVFVSVGHQQMMTDAIKPLGLSLWKLTALRPMFEAGGRLFVDVAEALAAPAARSGLLELLGRSDPLTRDALQSLLERGDFIAPPAHEDPVEPVRGARPPPPDPDPSMVTELMARNRESVAALERDIRSRSGPALVEFIMADLQELKRLLAEPGSHRVVMAGMEATWWLNEHLEAWLGEKGAADALARSAPHNVTSEMGRSLLDVADAVRPHPQVVGFLRETRDEGFLDRLDRFEGGREAGQAIRAFLAEYGMRCVGEIDVTRPRWVERPTSLLPLILSNVENFEPGAAERHLQQGRREACEKELALLGRVRALPDGESKAAETRRMIDLVRAFIGYREYPKYGLIRRYMVYKRALLDEAARLVDKGMFTEREDVFFLTLQELHDAVRTNRLDPELVARRREAFRSHQLLTPPRVLTSEGEVFAGAYRRGDQPAGALVGLAVSAGTVEGRARVVLDMADAALEPGDILVTAHTDPSWSPLFLTAAGLVTEVGGVMTHGSVIAREYGLPAVVGVENATVLIQDGQRLRVNGTDGFVELIGPAAA